MKRFKTIVLPLNLSMPPYWIGRAVSNALVLADWFEARLSVISELELGSLHETLEELGADLVYLTAGEEIGRSEGALLSGISVPIFLARPGLKLARDPFSSLFVPLGDDRRSVALDVGLDLAEQLDLPVDVLHVTQERCAPIQGLSELLRMSDEFPHEYPQTLESFIAQCSPFSSLSQRSKIRHFWHVCGERDYEVVERIGSDDRRIAIIDWKGSLSEGHASTVKSILSKTRAPVLLVRSAVRGATTLRAGRNFRAA